MVFYLKYCQGGFESEKREVFQRCPELKRQLWGGEFWGKGYFVNTFGQHGTEDRSIRQEPRVGKRTCSTQIRLPTQTFLNQMPRGLAPRMVYCDRTIGIPVPVMAVRLDFIPL